MAGAQIAQTCVSTGVSSQVARRHLPHPFRQSTFGFSGGRRRGPRLMPVGYVTGDGQGTPVTSWQVRAWASHVDVDAEAIH